jgi:hypothetical protein
MVLVQEDPHGEEHMIYYLRKSLSGPEHQYSHVLGENILNGSSSFRNSISNLLSPKLKNPWCLRSLSVTFPMLMMILRPNIISPMRLCSSSTRLILSMEISFFVSRPNVFSPISLVKSDVVFTIILAATFSSVTLCITMVLILSYDDV